MSCFFQPGFIMSEKPIRKLLLLRVAWAALFAGSTRRFYDRISDIYDKVFIDHFIHIESVVNLLIKFYPGKNCTVIDLGCGTGMLSKVLASHGFRVIGIDVSMESLRALKQSDKRVALLQGDAESLPFSDQSHQALVCLGVWRHLRCLELVLDEICRVLKKDGHFILGYFPPKLGGFFHVPDKPLGAFLVRLYHKTVRRFGYDDHVGCDLEKRSWQAIAKKFEQVRKIDSGKNWYLILAGRPLDEVRSFQYGLLSMPVPHPKSITVQFFPG